MKTYIILLIIVLVAGIIEAILNAKWNQFYFSYSIPVFIRRLEVQDCGKARTGIIKFINNIETIKGFKKYTGKIIDENTFFFRKKMVSSRRNDFDNIHGTIFIDTENREVIIKGRLSFSIIFAMLFMFFILTDSSESFLEMIPAIFIVLIILIINYLFERRKYNKLVKEITDRINPDVSTDD